jgi:hypothetical protein
VIEPDYLDHTGSRKLRDTIRKYWASKQCDVDVWIEDISMGDGMICCVRSDLVNGLPNRGD